MARACCENDTFLLGNYPQQSIGEIWNGARLAELRAAMHAGRMDLGCDGCAPAVVSGRRSDARVGTYDHLGVPSSAATGPVRLELELSNRCNLQCVMCNGELSSAIRSRREGRPPLPPVYDDRFFEELAGLAPTLREVLFQGGEPFLGSEPLRAFEVLADSGFAGRCHVTTNGTVANDRVRRILDRLRVDVSVSVDGWSASTFEAIRVGAAHSQVMANIAWFLEMARRRHTVVRFNHCVMRSNWHELHDVLAGADRLGIDVTVIDVRRPVSMSLHRADPAELGPVLDRMREQERRGPTLGRNAGSWARELAALEALVEGSPVALPVAVRRAGFEELEQWAADELTAWAEGGVVRFELDADEHIRSVAPDPGDVFGVDLRALYGASLKEAMAVTASQLGAFAGSVDAPSPPGTEDRSATFTTATGSAVLRSIIVTGEGRPSIMLVARRAG